MYAQPLPNNSARARYAAGLMLVNLALFSVLALKDLVKLISEDAYWDYFEYIRIPEAVLDFSQSILMIVTAVFFIMWFRRAYNNLFIAGARFLPYKEGWAAGGWFVPIVNWFYPYRIMNSIWVETPAAVRKVGEQYERPTDGNVGWWWTFWLIGNIVASIETQVILRSGVSIYEPGVIVLDLISDSALIIAAWLGLRLIRRISEMETDLQRRYNEWLAYQTQQYAQQYGQNQSFGQPQT